ALLARLQQDKLILPAEAEQIRQGPKDPKKPVISPSRWLYWNVHLDGLEKVHDIIVEREGVFRECVAAIKMAKALGFQVATNTTVYRETNMADIEALFEFLAGLDVDGHTITPGYDYDAAKRDMAKRLNLDPSKFFLTRRATIEKFQAAPAWSWHYPLFGTPIYFEFLAGRRDLTCSAWAIPTRNIKGWKAPCYFLTDTKCGDGGHFASYAELLEKVNWDQYGVVGGVARDPRCENCMVHCGYEPTASLGLQAKPGDMVKTLAFNFGPKPKPRRRPDPARVFDGISARSASPGEMAAAPAGSAGVRTRAHG
ncbi:MAG: DUF3463 domain-containing protein, partial [Verrucomicrobia bacterium]|nr:DUF3463 domain-containing protein [Verrucomicrobiota bacterium]